MSCHNYSKVQSRRDFLAKSTMGLGAIGLASLINPSHLLGGSENSLFEGLQSLPHFQPKAKRVIYLLQSGAPSQLDLFDHKPLLNEMYGQELPDSVMVDQASN